MLKAYRYRIYPTPEQSELIDKHFGCVRFIYNWALEHKIEAHKQGKKVSCFDLKKSLPKLKRQYQWLEEVNSQALQQTFLNLDHAYNSFFNHQNRFPKFKSKKDLHQSFQAPQHSWVDWDLKRLYLVKFKEGIRIVLHRSFEGRIKTVTISRTSTGKYFASILVDNDLPLPTKKKPKPDKTLGIDVGLKDFLTTSDGRYEDNPRFFRKGARRLAFLQRRLSRREKGSNRRQKAKLAVAKQHERITNQRKDFTHKLTTELIREPRYTSYAIEDLNVEGMLKNHKLSKSIADASWSEFFRQMWYKCDWSGKNLLVIGRFDASSKICSDCGWKNTELKLSDRSWTCRSCGSEHDRDINAARNIRDFAFKKIQGGNRPVRTVNVDNGRVSVKLPALCR